MTKLLNKDKYREEDELGQDESSLQSEEGFEAREIIVDPGQGALRIDKFLLDRIDTSSRNRIQGALKSGLITVNGVPVKPSYKVMPNDSIKVLWPIDPNYPTQILPEPMNLNIVYEDADLLIINKPAGLVVHPGVGNYSGTLVNGLAYHVDQIKSLQNLPGNELQPGLVHRIDKETSGLLVIAKNEQAMYNLAYQFYKHTIKREYIAVVWGSPDSAEGTIRSYLGRSQQDRKLVTVYPDGDYGKLAITHYKVLEDMYYVSVVACNLETGRTHQIRVHMQHLGHPVFSDQRYGGNKVVKGTVYTKYKQFEENCFELCPRQALHARSLGFKHPINGQDMYFECDLPPDMQALIEKWRNYVAHRKLEH